MKNRKIDLFITWSPRILSLGFVIFLSLFALDAFNQGSGWEIVLGFLMHLIPSFILLALALLSWKFELIGAIIFFGLSLLYILMVGFDRPWSWYVGISGPAMFVGALFLVSWLYHKNSRINNAKG